MSDAADDNLRLRIAGGSRNGLVDVRSFDRGVVETLGAKVYANGVLAESPDTPVPDANYYLIVDGIDPAPGQPGVQITWSYPEDVYEFEKLPMLLVRRDDISPAMQRWHPGAEKYQTAALGANPVLSGQSVFYDAWESQQQATPFDLTYTIQVMARHRGGPGQRNQANLLLAHVLKVYPPYGAVVVRDSLGDFRTYEAFMEGTSVVDEVAEVAERMIGFAVSLRVEGELDLINPETRKAVTTPPQFNWGP